MTAAAPLQRFFVLAGAVLLLINCSARLGVLFTSSPPLVLLLGAGGLAICLFPIIKPTYFKKVLFLFAVTFPFYGSFPYSSNSFLFESYLSFLSVTLLFAQFWQDKLNLRTNKLLLGVLLLYTLLSSFSLLLLPVRDIFWQLILWDWSTFWNAVYFATPESPLYSVAAVNRLLVFIVFVTLLSSRNDAEKLFRVIFLGLFFAAFWSSLVGLIDFFKGIQLNWLRPVFAGGDRLQSVFVNPGWFAEFLVVTAPLIVFGYLYLGKGKLKLLGMISATAIFLSAAVLSYSRTSWIIFSIFILSALFFMIGYFLFKHGRLSLKSMMSIFVKVFLPVLVIVPLAYFTILHVAYTEKGSGVTEGAKIKERVRLLLKPTVRSKIWKGTLKLVQEKPLYGLGYESYKFHNKILKKVRTKWNDTAHNLFLQLLVSGGIVGLSLWSILVAVILFLLVLDLTRRRKYQNFGVILSIIAFHLYGLTQAMQYIPMIWFLFFLSAGYAMTVIDIACPVYVPKVENKLLGLLFIVVMIGCVSYAADFESRKLATSENLKIYSLDQELESYRGFYPAEKWGEKGIFRWTGSKALIGLPHAEFFELSFVCSAPDVAKFPVIVSVLEDGREVDKIYFFQQQMITRRYYIPAARLENKKLNVHVSRTWNLKKSGIANDTRNLGVAISEIKVLDEFPADGIGFYGWEDWQGEPLPGRSEKSFRYRWTDKEAVFSSQQFIKDSNILIRAGQEGVEKNPLCVEFWDNGKMIKKEFLADNDWHKVSLIDEKINDSRFYKIIVSRTWNPKMVGVGDDYRSLGVAVAGLKVSRDE